MNLMPRGIEIVADWDRIKVDYFTGKYSCRELADRFAIPASAVRGRCAREGWNEKRKQLATKIESRAITRALTKTDQWVDVQFNRCNKFREKIMESLDMTGGPIDPQALDQLTKAEMRVDDMGRRALGLVDPQKVDITSGGMPLGAFSAALESIKSMVNRGEINADALDVDTLACAEIVKEGAAPPPRLTQESGQQADGPTDAVGLDG